MTAEEKQLLLKDLCARLPYRVKTLTPWENDGPGVLTLVDITSDRQVRVFEDWYKIEEIKPYLRPMSSMTEEEKKEWEFICSTSGYDINEGYIIEGLDWLNSHHFDYRGLIEKGLALIAPPDMYKF